MLNYGQPVTGQGMRVAVIDSGIDYIHPNLGGCFGPGCKVTGGYDHAFKIYGVYPLAPTPTSMDTPTPTPSTTHP